MGLREYGKGIDPLTMEQASIRNLYSYADGKEGFQCRAWSKLITESVLGGGSRRLDWHIYVDKDSSFDTQFLYYVFLIFMDI